MAKILKIILRKLRGSFPNKVFYWPNQYYVIFAFKILKMEFKFDYTRLITKVQSILASLFQ